MKRILIIVLTILLLLGITTCVFGCTKEVEIDEKSVIIRVDISKVGDNATLKDYMDYLEREEKLSYELSDDGMVTSINGKSGQSNEYWLLYTSDSQNSNTSWGNCNYAGKIYGSAIAGVETLIVKDGELYIWILQAF